MKKVLFLTVMLVVPFLSLAQKLIHECGELKVGIYKNVNEFQYNKPSIELKYNITSYTLKYKNPRTNEKLIRYKLDIDNKTSRTIGNVFGFCDGKNIYINDRTPRLKPKTSFSKIKILAPYCLYDNLSSSNTGGQYGVIIKIISEKMIYVKTGEILGFTKRNMRDVLTEYPDLLESFKNEERYSDAIFVEYYLKYIEEVNKK